jgi:hypothetical protein
MLYARQSKAVFKLHHLGNDTGTGFDPTDHRLWQVVAPVQEHTFLPIKLK